MAPFTYPSFIQAKQLLASKLGDASFVHYTAVECGLAIIEALRTWNSISLYYRDSYTITTVAGQAYYDLSTIIDFLSAPGLNNFTVYDRELINSLQFSLYEPPTTDWTALTPAMTEMFSITDIETALQKRRDQFLVDTGCTITQYSTTNPSVPQTGVVTLDEKVIDLRRLLYSSDSQPSPRILWRTDEFALNAFSTGWRPLNSNPTTYSISEVSPLQVRLIPGPTGTGRHIDYWAVSAGVELDVTASPNGTLMGIPNDLLWAVKFGALYDLLSRDGLANDPARADYCLQRYNEGVQIAQRVWTTLETASRFNSTPLNIGAIDSLDKYSPSWPSTTGQPKSISMIGPNIIAINPVPDSTYSMELFVVKNAPTPALDADIIQLGRDSLQAVIAYASHLLLFKEEGSEFMSSMNEYKAFFQLAMQQNARLRANAKFFDVLNDRGMLDEKFAPRIEEKVA